MLKRSIDIVISLLILLLFSPVCIAVAFAIWIESGRPILFRQMRVGKNFVRFEIFKFRTMRVDNSGPSITVGGDRRTTKVGRFLRATKIDEVPQFWNVLNGDMSIVGPRPEVLEYVELFEARYQNILTVLPGIADLASIYFRNEEAILAKSPDPFMAYRGQILPAKLDLADKYLQDQSALLDLVIILRTAAATLWPAVSAQSERLFGAPCKK